MYHIKELICFNYICRFNRGDKCTKDCVVLSGLTCPLHIKEENKGEFNIKKMEFPNYNDNPDYDKEHDEIIYHLISVVEQQTGYMRDDDKRETVYNSDAYAVSYLIKEGYAELRDGSNNFPKTKKIKFRWTMKGLDILHMKGV